MLIPIKEIIVEQGGLTPQQKLQIASGISTGVIGGVGAFQLYNYLHNAQYTGEIPTQRFSNYGFDSAPGPDRKYLAYEEAKINLDQDPNKEQIIQHLKDGLNNLNVPKGFYQNSDGNTLLNTYKDQSLLDSFR